MDSSDESYKRVVDLLRKSKPVLDSSSGIEREVVERIKIQKAQKSDFSRISDFIFGWVDIVWVRRTLITASCFMLVIFIWQQGIMMRKISEISRINEVPVKAVYPMQTNDYEQILTDYGNNYGKFPVTTGTIPVSDVKELLESLKEMESKYREIGKLIESDPELKKLIEEKLKNKKPDKNNM